MKRFRMDYPTTHPVEVECAERGWPNTDADGKTQFDNTHFDTEKECWEKLVREAEAAVSLDSSAVRKLRQQLSSAELALVNSVLVRDDISREKEKREAAHV